MAETARWIKLDPQELSRRLREREGRGEQVQGADVDVFVSPYDVPKAVRGFYNGSMDRFQIEFKYIEDEPTLRERKENHFALRIGKHSRRLYGVDIDVKALEAKFVTPRLAEAVQQAIADMEREACLNHSPRRGNYELARDVISSRAPELFESLAAQ